MIGKISVGKSPAGALRYVRSKVKAQEIESNFLSEDWQTQSLEFNLGKELKPNIEKHVYHVSLSLPPGESLTPEQWQLLGLDYMQSMGFDRAQYSTAIHHDTNNQHLHIVGNRVALDGSVVDIGYDRYRSQQVIRQIEKQYGLNQLNSSWEIDQKLDREMDSGKLFLVANEVGLPGELEKILPADHLYIVYANPEGLEYFVRAGAENSFPHIEITTGEYLPGSIDWPEDPTTTYSVELDIGDRDAGELFSQLKERFYSYEKLIYGGLTANCNSCAISALEAVGIEPILPDTGRVTPGVDKDLNATIASLDKIDEGNFIDSAIGWGEVISGYDRGLLSGAKDVVTYYGDKAVEKIEEILTTNEVDKETIPPVEAVKIFQDFLDLHGENLEEYLFFEGEDWSIAENKAGGLIVTRKLDDSVLLRVEENDVLFFDLQEKELEKLTEIKDYLESDLSLQLLVSESMTERESELEL